MAKINREKLRNLIIKKICRFGDGVTEFHTQHVSELIYWIKELEAKQKLSQQWIPVEKELPPPEESVLVKDCFGKHRVSVLMDDMKTWKTISLSDGRVTHWRQI